MITWGAPFMSAPRIWRRCGRRGGAAGLGRGPHGVRRVPLSPLRVPWARAAAARPPPRVGPPGRPGAAGSECANLKRPKPELWRTPPSGVPVGSALAVPPSRRFGQPGLI
jgi:hypothetical protein